MVETYSLAGITGKNCIELSNSARCFFGVPLIIFSDAVLKAFESPEIESCQLIPLIASQCEKVQDRKTFDLCVIGTPSRCSIATVINDSLLYLNSHGHSDLIKMARLPAKSFIDGYWRVNQEWLCPQ
jgi:hypothetical protein